MEMGNPCCSLYWLCGFGQDCDCFLCDRCGDCGGIIHTWLAFLEIASSLGHDGFDGNPCVYLLHSRTSGPFG